mgnify:CR=1 FL=1
MADKTKLDIILTNFTSNAIKYNREGGKVTVSHALQDNMVVTSVQDNGLGIPAEQQAKMFQKFFRVEGDDRKNIPGTGLGMYITKQFIEAMGGKLWFESVAGQGTTFHFSLPVAQAAQTVTPAPPPGATVEINQSVPPAVPQSTPSVTANTLEAAPVVHETPKI